MCMIVAELQRLMGSLDVSWMTEKRKTVFSRCSKNIATTPKRLRVRLAFLRPAMNSDSFEQTWLCSFVADQKTGVAPKTEEKEKEKASAAAGVVAREAATTALRKRASYETKHKTPQKKTKLSKIISELTEKTGD